MNQVTKQTAPPPERPPESPRPYKRAAYGLGIAAIAWTVALLIAQQREGVTSDPISWLIPLGAAALSVCFLVLQRNQQD